MDGSTLTDINLETQQHLIAIPKGRNGMWYDLETGMYCVRARCYDPILGRWLQKDPNETALAQPSQI